MKDIIIINACRTILSGSTGLYYPTEGRFGLIGFVQDDFDDIIDIGNIDLTVTIDISINRTSLTTDFFLGDIGKLIPIVGTLVASCCTNWDIYNLAVPYTLKQLSPPILGAVALQDVITLRDLQL